MDGFIVKRVSKLVAMKEVQSVVVACSGVGVPGEVSTLLIQVPFFMQPIQQRIVTLMTIRCA